MKLIGRICGVDILADTEDPREFARIEKLMQRAFTPQSAWDYDSEAKRFIERPRCPAPRWLQRLALRVFSVGSRAAGR